MTGDKYKVLELLRGEVSGQVGYALDKDGKRVYGSSDDHIIELCADIIINRLNKNIRALL